MHADNPDPWQENVDRLQSEVDRQLADFEEKGYLVLYLDALRFHASMAPFDSERHLRGDAFVNGREVPLPDDDEMFTWERWLLGAGEILSCWNDDPDDDVTYWHLGVVIALHGSPDRILRAVRFEEVTDLDESGREGDESPVIGQIGPRGRQPDPV